MAGLWSFIRFVLTLYILILFVRFAIEWVRVFARSWRPTGAVAVGLELVYSVTDPPLKAVRRVLPPLRLGNFSLDLGLWVTLIVLYILMSVIPRS